MVNIVNRICGITKMNMGPLKQTFVNILELLQEKKVDLRLESMKLSVSEDRCNPYSSNALDKNNQA